MFGNFSGPGPPSNGTLNTIESVLGSMDRESTKKFVANVWAFLHNCILPIVFHLLKFYIQVCKKNLPLKTCLFAPRANPIRVFAEYVLFSNLFQNLQSSATLT